MGSRLKPAPRNSAVLPISGARTGQPSHLNQVQTSTVDRFCGLQLPCSQIRESGSIRARTTGRPWIVSLL